MFDSLQALQDAILKTDPKSFVSHYIIEPIPFAFSGDFTGWLGWKESLASLIDVDPHDVVMTGSAALGYSLNPDKGFKQFDSASDFDCGVISAYYFDVAWRFLRQSQVSWLSYPSKTRYALNSHRKRYVFQGTIATDMILGVLPFGKEWLGALRAMETGSAAGRDVKLRIYKDFDALRFYQANNIQRLRDAMADDLEKHVEDTPLNEIPIEDEK